MKQAVILAGGKGTRLKDRLGDLPKPLISIAGMPLLERQILSLKTYHFDHILILVNYKAEAIIDFCESRQNWNLNIKIMDDGDPKGTAGAILNSLDYLEDDFLVVYGDTMFDIDFDRFWDFHNLDPLSAGTLFLHPNDHPYDSDLVELDKNEYIKNFLPYPHQPEYYYANLVNAALYFLRKKSLLHYRDDLINIFDFGKHLFPKMLTDGYLLRAYRSPEYIKDCGTPDRVDKVEKDFLSEKISNASLKKMQPAVFIDRDGTINIEKAYLASVDDFELIPQVAQAIKAFNNAGHKVCVITNQPVIARGECSIETLNHIHNKLETLIGSEGAFIDRIYYCPHHPDDGFEGEIKKLKVHCNCRKPNTGMIEQAVLDLNINLSNAWLIGDRTTDILAAQKLGIKSILVETGCAGLDAKFNVYPDFILPNLKEASSFILEKFPKLMVKYRCLVNEIKKGEVIYIGGQSRSGKSILASLFKFLLLERDIKSCVISTDRWILSKENRGSGFLGRHAMHDLNTFLNKISNLELRGRELSLPYYQKILGKQIQDIDRVKINHDDVVIIEGVTALLTQGAKNSKKYFVEISESKRKDRVVNEYQLRGLSESESIEIYNQRLQDEIYLIEQASLNAYKLEAPF